MTALMTIFSLDDEPDTIAGSLGSLEFDGHTVEQRQDLDEARQYLAANDVDLVLVDECVGGCDNGGSALIMELKRGGLGPRNAGVPFAFVTGNLQSINEPAISRLPGFLEVKVKGGALTRDLRRLIAGLSRPRRDAQASSADDPGSGGKAAARDAAPGDASVAVIEAPPPSVPATAPQRVAIRIVGLDRSHAGPARVLLRIPAWSSEEQIAYPLASLPPSVGDLHAQLFDRWLIGRVNVVEPDASRVAVSDWEPQEEDDIRRVPLLIESLDDEHVVARVPAWEPDIPIRFNRMSLPRDLRDELESLPGTWLMAQMNLYETDPDRLVICGFERTEPLDDDDGLA